MPERKIRFIENEIYHIYNRGSFKHDIFHDESDYERFQKILYLSNGIRQFKYKDLVKFEKNIFSYDKGKEIVNVMSYVLMPNHFHLMIEVLPSSLYSPVPAGGIENSLSLYIKRVTSAYAMYYNRKYKKTGSLFEGRFKSEHVNNNNYFKYLFSYIHLNPLKIHQRNWREIGLNDVNGAKIFLENYKYSSFSEYFPVIRFSSPVPAGGRKKVNLPGYGKIINKNSFLSRIPEGTDLSQEIFDWLNFKTINIE